MNEYSNNKAPPTIYGFEAQILRIKGYPKCRLLPTPDLNPSIGFS